MPRQILRFFLCCLVIGPAYGSRLAYAQEANHPPNGFRPLFNGRDLEGWHGRPHRDPREIWKMSDTERQQMQSASLTGLREHWRVDDGVIINDGHGDYLTTNEDFGDIELFIDFLIAPKTDSGIYVRGTPQIQIWDPTEAGGQWKLGADKGSGGLWNNSPGAPGKDPSMLADKRLQEWNRFRIVQIGERTSVWLNGQLVVDHAVMENFWDRKLRLFPRGPIQLQTHGGEIHWRNIFVRPLGADEANELLSAHGEEGFQPIFNGQDLTGWSGATSGYEVHDGAIRCKSGSGGQLYTSEKYGDFAVRLEFQLPPAGNNGLAIRYSGSGDPAYEGMCELQVLDSEHARYADLDARQYHGSAYGMAAAQRGYLRPAGEWNFQEVTVRGTHIRVELNGTAILDADLAKVTEFLADHPHPGKDNSTGHFGFAGHGDPVAFRQIRLKRL